MSRTSKNMNDYANTTAGLPVAFDSSFRPIPEEDGDSKPPFQGDGSFGRSASAAATVTPSRDSPTAGGHGSINSSQKRNHESMYTSSSSKTPAEASLKPASASGSVLASPVDTKQDDMNSPIPKKKKKHNQSAASSLILNLPPPPPVNRFAGRKSWFRPSYHTPASKQGNHKKQKGKGHHMMMSNKGKGNHNPDYNAIQTTEKRRVNHIPSKHMTPTMTCFKHAGGGGGLHRRRAGFTPSPTVRHSTQMNLFHSTQIDPSTAMTIGQQAKDRLSTR